ncbi:hypothetical protein ScPMuIL_011498 [Solemya velum]
MSGLVSAHSLTKFQCLCIFCCFSEASFDMTSNTMNIEELRGPYESNVEWNLRRLFLEEHKDRFPEDRLVCLSNCFINVEMYGCRYPGPVMEQLKELSSSLPRDQLANRTKVKGSEKIPFVKSSDSSTTSDRIHENRPHTGGHGGNHGSKSEFESVDMQRLKRKDGPDRFGPDSESHLKSLKVLPAKYQDLLKETKLLAEKEREMIIEKFHLLAKQIALTRDHSNSCVELINEAVTTMQMTIICEIKECTENMGENKFDCILKIDSVQVAIGTGSSDNDAKQNAYLKALDMLGNTDFQVGNKGLEQKVLHGNCSSFDEEPDALPELIETNIKNLGKNCYKSTTSLNFKEFIINHPDMPTYKPNSLIILRQSCDGNKVLLEFYMTGTTCTVKLNGQTMGEGKHPKKKVAKDLAADSALENLQKVCWTLKIKKKTDSDGLEMTREEVLAGNAGIGGVATMVSDNPTASRLYLGRFAQRGVEPKMATGIRQVVQNYAKSGNPDDLVFSLDFTDDERALLQAEGQKYGLITKGRGANRAKRHLTLSRKRTTRELFNDLKKWGPTHKYELVPPTNEVH